MEVWESLEKVVPGGEKYEVSTLGNIRNSRSGRILKPVLTNRGYGRVTIKGKLYSIHRLVALAFLPRVKGKTQVNHISGIKTDNSLTNLEWVSPSENIKHSFSIGMSSTDTQKKPVNKYDLSGNLIESFDSVTEAGQKTGTKLPTIVYQCKNYGKSRYGNFYFRYADSENVG